MTMMSLDCRGLCCPMPIVKVSRAMKQLASGDRLTISANDAAFRADLEAWVKKLGYVLESFADGPEQLATVRKV